MSTNLLLRTKPGATIYRVDLGDTADVGFDGILALVAEYDEVCGTHFTKLICDPDIQIAWYNDEERVCPYENTVLIGDDKEMELKE